MTLGLAGFVALSNTRTHTPSGGSLTAYSELQHRVYHHHRNNGKKIHRENTAHRNGIFAALLCLISVGKWWIDERVGRILRWCAENRQISNYVWFFFSLRFVSFFYFVLIPFGYTFAIWSIWITCSSFNKFKFEYILMYSVYTISQTNQKRTTHFRFTIVLCWHSLVWTLKCVCAHTHTCLRTLFKISPAKFNIYCWLSIWPGAGEYFGCSAHIHRVAASASILIENMCTHTHRAHFSDCMPFRIGHAVHMLVWLGERVRERDHQIDTG